MERIRNIAKDNAINEENFNDFIYLDFTTTTLDGREVELIPGGKDIQVTWENKFLYTKLVEEFRLSECSNQLRAIKKGFYQIVKKSQIALMTSQELQERISGKKDINIEYLKQNTEYDGYDESNPVIKYFWDTLRSFTNEQRSSFLRFVWGRTTLPPTSEEFEEKMLVIRSEQESPANNDTALPQSHTCTFQLELPPYSSEKILRDKLLYAITNCRDIDLEWRAEDEQ